MNKPTIADYTKLQSLSPESSEFHDLYNQFDWSTQTFQVNGKYGLKNCIGEQLVAPHYDDFMSLSGSDIALGRRVVAKKDGLWGVLIANGTGKWLLEPEFDYIGYPNSITFVHKEGKYSVIDLSSMKWIVTGCETLSFEQGFLFVNEIALFEKDGKSGVILPSGEVTPAKFDEITIEDSGYAYAYARIGDIWGYIDVNSNLVEDMDDAYFIGDSM